LASPQLTPGGKAAQAGVAVGDWVLSIDGENAGSLTHIEAQNKIRACGERLSLGLSRWGRWPGWWVLACAFWPDPPTPLSLLLQGPASSEQAAEGKQDRGHQGCGKEGLELELPALLGPALVP
jgi:hypothetical protein